MDLLKSIAQRQEEGGKDGFCFMFFSKFSKILKVQTLFGGFAEIHSSFCV